MHAPRKAPAHLRHPDPFDMDVVWTARRHAEAEYPKESCGFICEDGYMPCENVHPNPTEAFRVSAEDTAVALQRGATALVHSHPDGPNFPTFDDQECQIGSGMIWGIVPVIGVSEGDEMRGVSSDVVWWGDKLPPLPLERRKFVWGVLHCYALFRDWWWQERGVRIPNFPCPEDFVDTGYSIFIDQCEKAGLRNIGKIDMADLQIGDMLVGHLKGEFPNHCGVYIGGDDFLHHPEDGISGPANLLRWWKHIDTVMRYDDGLANAAHLRGTR